MKNILSNKKRNIPYSFDDIINVKIFQNKNNKQFNLPVLKKNTSPKIIRDILENDNVIGLKLKIEDIILKPDMKGNGIMLNYY